MGGAGDAPTLTPTHGTVNPGQTVTTQANPPIGGSGGPQLFSFTWNGHNQTFNVNCVMP
jgi:hypothetical protein